MRPPNMPRTHRSPHPSRRSNGSTRTDSPAETRKESRRMTAIKEAPRTLGLSGEQLLAIYYKMLLARTLSIRQRLLQRMGKGAITYSGEGHEAAQVGTAFALRPGTDWLYTYYRDVGVVLT